MRTTYVRDEFFVKTSTRTGTAARIQREIIRKFRVSLRNSIFAKGWTSPRRGSREHFFHFLLGYLLPLVHAQTNLRVNEFLVLDCGPVMTPNLKETLMRLGYQFEIVSPSAIEEPFYLEPWERAWDSSAVVRATANLVREAWDDYGCAQKECAKSENLLLKRQAPPDYYTHGGAEVKGYGTSRRDITNWPEVCDLLSNRGIDYVLYEPGQHSLGCQIATFSVARRIAGMRGAEWANTIWSPPGLRARVLDPNPPAILLTNLFHRLDVSYEFQLPKKTHVPENPVELARFLTEP